VEYCVQNDRFRRSMQSEIADDIGFPGSGCRDLRRLERDVGILDRIEPFFVFQFAASAASSAEKWLVKLFDV
jgi:hypothetical protein